MCCNRQLAAIQDNMLASSTSVRRAVTDDEQPVRELGQRLFEALIADDVRVLYENGRRRARAEPLARSQVRHSVRHKAPVVLGVKAVTFSPDGRRLATTSSSDKTARIWLLSDDE